MSNIIPGQNWYAVKDGDNTARSLFDRHYSAAGSLSGTTDISRWKDATP